MTKRIFLILIAVITIIFFVLALQFLPILKYITSATGYVVNPISRAFYGGVNYVSENISFLLHSKSHLQEIKELKDQVGNLSVQVANLQSLSAENDTLKKQLNFLTGKTISYVVAGVIGRSSDQGQVILILDKGSRDGVVDGLPVIIDDGVFVGKITKVELGQSLVLISISSQSRVAATIASRATTAGLVSGEHNIGLKMESIPKDAVVNKDDLVVTSGLESSIPSGLVIGKVSDVSAGSSDLFQSAYLVPLYSINNLRLVSILLPLR